MTEPAPLQFFDPYTALQWCSCGVHYATTIQPLCPVCLDIATRAQKAAPLDLTA